MPVHYIYNLFSIIYEFFHILCKFFAKKQQFTVIIVRNSNSLSKYHNTTANFCGRIKNLWKYISITIGCIVMYVSWQFHMRTISYPKIKFCIKIFHFIPWILILLIIYKVFNRLFSLYNIYLLILFVDIPQLYWFLPWVCVPVYKQIIQYLQVHLISYINTNKHMRNAQRNSNYTNNCL